VINADETIKRGASAMPAFRRLSALSSAGIQVLPLPKPAAAIPPPLVPFIDDDVVPTGDPDDENMPVTHRGDDPQELSSYASASSAPVRCRDDAALESVVGTSFHRMMKFINQRLTMEASQNRRPNRYTPPQRPSSPSPASEFDIHDSFFDAVDVDAIVASRAPAEAPTDPARSKRSVQEPSFGVPYSHSSSACATLRTTNNDDREGVFSGSAESDHHAPDRIKEAIKATRDRLREVREECDDASLEGDIPSHLSAARARLEAKLEDLSRHYRHLKTSLQAVPSGSRSEATFAEQHGSSFANRAPTFSKPQCSCGMQTTEARVQHGPNANRLYYRCSSCGFHSWADASERGSSPRQCMSSEFTSSEVTTPSDPGVREKIIRAKQVLRDVFGHNAFRPNQERVVIEGFSGRDVFVLMPTGGGKSLCYQLPACVDEGVTVVISPLVSLIQDQVQQLEALDVGVAHLNGEQDYDTVQRPIISELYSNRIRIKLLYVTPEKIASSNTLNNIFESLEKRGMLARFVVDEAHCISQWGHDFRKDYFQLGQLRTKFKSVSGSEQD
jgi:hypothetical protein